MKEIRWIDDNIWQYVFIESEDKPYIDVNITVLINGERAMLIDTGYTNHALLVKKDLSSKGITVDKILLSHYHPDHAAGAVVFTDAILSCSAHYEENFNNCKYIWDKENEYRKPQRTILDNMESKYGSFSLSFYETPGHSKCSIVTLINDKIAHVGDLLMFDVDGKPILPYICDDGSFKEHLESLEIIKELDVEVLILSHGKYLVGKEAINQAVDMRKYYLKSVIETKGNSDIEELLIGGSKNWTCTEWHIDNLKFIQN